MIPLLALYTNQTSDILSVIVLFFSCYFTFIAYSTPYSSVRLSEIKYQFPCAISYSDLILRS